jgi:hypothetical protein
MGDALLAARDICLVRPEEYEAFQKFIRTTNRLKPFHGQRPVMAEAEKALLNLAAMLEQAGYSNPKYAIPNELIAARSIAIGALSELKPVIIATYEFVAEKQMQWANFGESNTNRKYNFESDLEINFEEVIVPVVKIHRTNDRLYYKDADNNIYVKSLLGYKRFNSLEEALDYVGDPR